MAEGVHCEIERKYLIHYPDVALLRRQSGCETWEILQTYLRMGEGGQTRRVRRVTSDGQTRCFRTFKRMIDALSSEEDEAEITPQEYRALLEERDPARRPISKTRYRIPWAGHTLEFDVYPFWEDRAILEIELDSEDDAPPLPDYVRVMRDVSAERAYRNSQLALCVPME